MFERSRAIATTFLSVGFRPFFLLAIISGAILPFLWALSYFQLVNLEFSSVNVLQWHAHEMLFGFGWAVLGGFLLTASKNWVKIRGLHGGWLLAAVGLWITERLALIYVPAETPSVIRFLLLHAFVLFIGSYIVYCLLRFRKQDSFKDNYFFAIGLPLFLVAKVLLLNADTYTFGFSMAIGLFRLAFAVMFERTVTQFMKNTEGVTLFRSPKLDLPIKFLILLSVFESFFPNTLGAIVLALAGLLFLSRFFLWQPAKAFKHFGIAIMYIGYFALGSNLLFSSVAKFGFGFIGSLSVHVFTFLCMGVVIPGMMIRISQGHTGRPIQFTISDRIAISLILIASAFRLFATQVWPQSYSTWIGIAGVLWSACFVIIGLRITPFLFVPRIDGKVH